MTISRFVVMICCLALLVNAAAAWEWESDETILNPTGLPIESVDYACYSIFNPGPLNELSWIYFDTESHLIRLIPQWNESDEIIGWERDEEYFAGVLATTTPFQINFGNWYPGVSGTQLVVEDYFQEPLFFRNVGTGTNPSWDWMDNPFSELFSTDPPCGFAAGDIDRDDNPDVVHYKDSLLVHYEWDVNDGWALVDTLLDLADWEGEAVHLRCRDLDLDGDDDFLLVSSQPGSWYAYDVIENQSTSETLQFSDPIRLPTWQGLSDAADIDGDGSVELVFPYGYAHAVAETPFQWQDPVCFVPRYIDFFDHDSEGGLRWIARPQWNESLRTQWCLRSGIVSEAGFITTNWADSLFLPVQDTGFSGVAVGGIQDDLNNDDLLDMMLLGYQGELHVYRNEGSNDVPEYVEAEELFEFNPGAYGHRLQARDLDENGYLDYMFYGTDVGWLIFMGDAEQDGSRFWDYSSEVVEGIDEVGIGFKNFGDFDGDGDADMIFTSAYATRLYLNQVNGEIRFWDQEPGALPDGLHISEYTTCFDFDNDGLVDIVNGNNIYLSRYMSGVGQNETRPLISTISVAPNPFNASARVSVILPQAGQGRVELFNLLGQRVALLHDGLLHAGTSELHLDGTSLSSGTYMLHISVPGMEQTRRVVLVK